MRSKLPIRVNCTVTCSFNCDFDLPCVAKLLNIVYDPRHFQALILRSKLHYATILLFRNGKVVACGRDADFAIDYTHKRLAELGYPVHIKDRRLVNSVYAGHLDRFINIQRLKHAHFDGERFSGASIRLPDATLVVFHTGTYYLTGVRGDSPPDVQHLLNGGD